MEKKVQKISLTSDPEAVYFIQIAWKKDLGNGFNVTVCNGHSAWIGEVSKEDITKEANDMEMDRRKYVDELKKALILTIPPSAKYSFDLMKDGDSSETFSFTYEKKLKDLSYKLGSLKLAKSQNPADIIRDLIDYCLNRTMELYNQNDHLQKENERLQSDWKDMHEQLQKCVSSKEELEQDLYTKFTYVLNEKKGKIRSLKEKLDLAQQRVQQTCDNSAFDTVPVSQIKDDDYGGTTEEETESQEATTGPAGPSQYQQTKKIDNIEKQGRNRPITRCEKPALRYNYLMDLWMFGGHYIYRLCCNIIGALKILRLSKYFNCSVAV
ncbi:DNA repair protein XRCC4 isoform X2 [Spea bombifrons]|uniref:DNA repair protein XRCC4 isoform X2 n=1 Tax=Spea bombifrons TaxID=233779 RepID=UPI00234AE180|nr:DNA repair protein XRCC4 isoform X2 [Spea bombifrons]